MSPRTGCIKKYKHQRRRSRIITTRRLGFGGCAFDYAIDEQQDDGTYD
jgi:hypothetical protein